MKQNTLISGFLSMLPMEHRGLFGDIVNYLAELGYIPQKTSAKTHITLAFKRGRQVIAKMRAYNGGEFQVKFFACENPPQKYRDALRYDAQGRDNESKNEYIKFMNPDRPAYLKNKCEQCCNVCTGGNLGYVYKRADGREIFHCGAYPVSIPNITADDLPEIKRLIAEQDKYFKTLCAKGVKNDMPKM